MFSVMDAIERWHDYTQSRDMEALAALLSDEVVFESPIVHTPQEGKAITLAYLGAAMRVLGGDDFRYVGEWRGERGTVLEFETRLGETLVNGVDIIDTDESGALITRFKVMVRPMKAIQAVGLAMRAELERQGPSA